MKTRMGKCLVTMTMLMILSVSASAQCAFKNTAFKGGETLSYNLYYNWKFVWVKAGSASMHTVASNYEGKEAFRASLTTRGNNKVDEMFVLRDTLLCYCTTDMVPLYFRKGAREGKRYTVDEVWYDYKDSKVNLRQRRMRKDGTAKTITNTSNDCVYDMLNIFLRARSFNPEGWQKGHVVKIPIADGNSIDEAILKYRGKSTIKGDNGYKYRCLELSYMEMEKGKYKEIVRFYVTDDSNHIPVRLDLFLRFGSAKAFVTNIRGNRNAIEAIVR
ncbi:MAG: DUF3108 domain-containing protein [Prevotella sp.]|nr:DUF3108 domain-containing protein [Prevotella sp.]